MSADEKVFLVNAQGAEPTVKALNLPEGEVRSVSLGNTGISLVTGDRKLLTSKIKDGTFKDWKHPEESTQFKLTQVESGLSHHVAITTDYKMVSWGDNDHGQLGTGDVNSKEGEGKDFDVPVSLVPFLQNTKICAVSCGNAHNLCLSDNGQVYSWGSNDCNQLGLGNTSLILCTKPRLVQDLAHVSIAQISAGGQHSFVVSATGDIFCWGLNRFGQLGFENTDPSTSYTCERPRQLLQKAKSVSCGGNHTALLTLDGQVYTCGLGSSGQLGHFPRTENELNPRKIEELENVSVSRIACGRDYTVVYTQPTNNLYYFGGQKKSVINLPCGLNDTMLECGKGILLVYEAHFDIEDEIRFGHMPLTLDMVMRMMRTRGEDRQHDIKQALNRALSQATCVNRSFLLKSTDTRFSDSCHNVDLDTADEFFNEVRTPIYYKTVEQALKTMMESLSHETIKNDTLRLFLLLPCCLYEETSLEYCNDIATSLVHLISGLQQGQRDILEKWLKSISANHFKRYVSFFRRCIEGQLRKLAQGDDPDQIDVDGSEPTMEFLMQALNNSMRTLGDRMRRINSSLVWVEKSANVLDLLNEVNKHRRTPISYQDFYVRNLKEVVNIRGDYNSRKQDIENEKPSTFRFCKYPFLYNSKAKAVLLKGFCKEAMEADDVCMLGLTLVQRTIGMNVRRTHLLEDSRGLILQQEKDLRKRLDVVFRDENKESGKGIRQEFFRLLVEILMDESFGAFYYEDQAVLQWFKVKGDHESSNLDDIRFIGFICGMALYNGVTLRFDFPTALYRKLLDKPVSYEDLLDLKPVPYRFCKEAHEHPDDDFEDGILNFGMPVELCPNGADIKVNSSNKHEYAEKLTDYYLNKAVDKEFESFRAGFYKGIPRKFVMSFQPEELQEILIGKEDYDFNALERNVVYTGDYHRNHETIEMFWEVFHEMEFEKQKKFLTFLTGTDRVPVFGMEKYLMRISPQNCHNPDRRLPWAETCSNTLLLPRYTSKEALKTNLLMAVECETGFGLL